MARGLVASFTPFSNNAGATTAAISRNGVAAGALLTAEFRAEDNSTTLSVSDNVGGTWVAFKKESTTGNLVQGWIAYSWNHPGGNVTITGTFGTSVPYRRVFAQEWQGGDSSDPYFAGSLRDSTATLNLSVPTSPPCMVLGLQVNYNSGTITASSPAVDLGNEPLMAVSYIGGLTSGSSQTIANTGGTGSAASLAVCFKDPAGGTATDLSISGATHGHTADNLTLTTATTPSIADCTHGHTADALTLSTGTLLVVAEASHAHTADALTLSTGTSLTVAEASHAHTADSLGLTTDSTLAVADASHGHTAENLTLVPTTGDTLVVQDATHAHSADALVLSTDQFLAIADAVHAHTAESPALSTQILLTVADAAHAHSADNITLSDVPALVIADALHAHAADSIALTSEAWLDVQDALHAHRADSLLLDTGDGQYDVDDGRLLPVAGGRDGALSVGYSLTVNGGRTANFVR